MHILFIVRRNISSQKESRWKLARMVIMVIKVIMVIMVIIHVLHSSMLGFL